jgi:serine/threonine-protein kinase
LAEDLERWLKGEPVEARPASRAERLLRWGRRHRAAVTAAVCLLVALAALVGSVGWVLGDRGARQREAEANVRQALDAAAPGLEQGNPMDPALVAAAQRAEAQLNGGVLGPEWRGLVEQLLSDVGMLARLDNARLQAAAGGKGTIFDIAGADLLYAEAFAWYGLALSPQEIADRVRASAIRIHLTAGLDDWSTVKDVLERRSGASLWTIADLADDDPWRRQLRRAARHRDRADDRAALEGLAEEVGASGQPAAYLAWLARTLRDVGSAAAAERLLRRAHQGRPADFWINFELACTFDWKQPPDWAEAARFYQAALALRPNSPVVWNNLGVKLKEQGKLVEAEASFRKVIELKPDYPEAHNNLGAALNAQGRPAEAEAPFRRAIELKHDYPTAHNNLGGTLFDLGRQEAAIAEFQEAIRLDPKYEQAQKNLDRALKMVQVRDRLPAVLQGKDQPKDADERLDFADFCQQPFRQQHTAAARFYAEAFAQKPQLADDLRLQHRYNAACEAVLAGCGQGQDADRSDDQERGRLRRQALEWLQADLAAYRQLLEKEPEKARALVRPRMQHWRVDPDLAGVRDRAEVTKLPTAEQQAWRKLWAEVAALLGTSHAASPIKALPPPKEQTEFARIPP